MRLLNSLLSRAQLPEGAAQRCTLAVSTVDGYQGREADCVVFSSVRWSVAAIFDCMLACSRPLLNGECAGWQAIPYRIHRLTRRCVPATCLLCSNAKGRVGFLSDERRLNVAITRPRRGLIVIGHQATLQHDPTWNAWMQWVAAQRRQRQNVDPPRQEDQPPPAAE